jgi:hypothetical protein
MLRQISKIPIKRKRQLKRIGRLNKTGRAVKGVVIPKGSLAADPDKQNDSVFSTKFYYQNIPYSCAGCGRKGIWTAEQQKRYFETQKGNIYNKPKWCFECHFKRMQNKIAEHGTAHNCGSRPEAHKASRR